MRRRGEGLKKGWGGGGGGGHTLPEDTVPCCNTELVTSSLSGATSFQRYLVFPVEIK